MVDINSNQEIIYKAVNSGVKAMGARLWHLETNRIPEGYEFILEIDSDNLTARLCEQVAKQVKATLGAEGIVKDEIFIDVSSPGLCRRLYSIEHCREYKGQQVSCSFANGSKLFGLITEVFDDNLTLELSEGTSCKVKFSEVNKINLQEF